VAHQGVGRLAVAIHADQRSRVILGALHGERAVGDVDRATVLDALNLALGGSAAAIPADHIAHGERARLGFRVGAEIHEAPDLGFEALGHLVFSHGDRLQESVHGAVANEARCRE
jgi:hypothetical protein